MQETIDLIIRRLKTPVQFDFIYPLAGRTIWPVFAALTAACWADLLMVNRTVWYPQLFSSVETLQLEILAVNATFGIALYGLFRIIFARWSAALLASTLALGFAAISATKMRHLHIPLLPWDIVFVGQIGDLVKFIDLKIAGYVGSGIIICFTLWQLKCRFQWPFFRERFNAFAILAGIVPMMAWTTTVAEGKVEKLSSAGIRNLVWDQRANFFDYGPFYTFFANWNFMSLSPPSKEAALSAAGIDHHAIPASSSTTERPDIVTILSEAFTDLPTRIFNRPYTCLAAAPLSKLITPSWGGLTANVEFEILTGYPHALFPAGSVPYQMYLHLPLQDSLPREFARAGYLPTAIHSFDRHFYGRPHAYEMLGFIAYEGLEDLPNPVKAGQYVSDDYLFHQVLHQLDGARNQLHFVHVVTMMAHLPYSNSDRYPVPDAIAKALPAALEPYRSSVTQYAAMMFDHERMLCSFLDALKKRKRRTIVLFYGDHYPGFDDPDTYRAIHAYLHPDNKPSFDLYKQYSETPVFLFDNRTGFIPLPDEIPAYNLGTRLLEQAGLPVEHVWAMPHKLNNRIIARRLTIASDNKDAGIDGQSDAIDQELETLKAHAYIHLAPSS
jgi:phosphoglycerol transferase MdoB-like AlkP superfamily enzyme